MKATTAAPSATTATATTANTGAVWNEQLQQYHGGQDWKFLPNFLEDFSVTTNGLGTPSAALKAATDAMSTCHHYPPANQEPALSSLAQFLWPASSNGDHSHGAGWQQEKCRLLLGNGASELIDLVVRVAPSGPWAPGPSRVQYKEYQRSAESHGRAILTSPESLSAKFVACVNPTNPTGDYMTVDEMKHWIGKNVADGATCTVDESMQPWVGEHWRQDSLVTQQEWILDQFQQRRVSIYVIHSWTKIWSCTGLRLGSIVCPTSEHADALRRLQVPWSVNAPALVFLDSVVRDAEYMRETWRLTPEWNRYARKQLAALNPQWLLHGGDYLSWIWIDMGAVDQARQAVELARAAGVPVRWGKPGYALPSFVRIAVRPPQLTEALLAAWRSLV